MFSSLRNIRGGARYTLAPSQHWGHPLDPDTYAYVVMIDLGLLLRRQYICISVLKRLSAEQRQAEEVHDYLRLTAIT